MVGFGLAMPLYSLKREPACATSTRLRPEGFNRRRPMNEAKRVMNGDPFSLQSSLIDCYAFASLLNE